MRAFDKKFGSKFIQTVPSLPGIYKFYSEQSNLIYVGKAKNLRRRLQQYQNARRCKKHKKMHIIIKEAAKLDYEICTSELEAQILETRLIQNYRPKWNVSGAFYFLYPVIGMKVNQNTTSFIYSTQYEFLSKFQFDFHGAFRSREMTSEAFFSLMELLKYIGHLVPKKQNSISDLPKFTYLYEFRQLPEDWGNLWSDFWQGRSKELLQELVLKLVENAGARGRPIEIQECIRKIVRFWKHEALILWEARQKTQFQKYPVSQKERDILFLNYRMSYKSNI